MKFLKLLTTLLIISYNSYSANPVGTLDNASIDAANGINGWAFDPDNSQASISVAYYIYDGTTLLKSEIKPTSTYRPDVNTKWGITGNHGFSFEISPGYANKTIYISAGNIGLGQDIILPGSPTTIKLKSNLLYSPYFDQLTKRKLLTDLYRPATTPANKKLPLIVLVHGGGFFRGCKRYFEDNYYARNMASVGYVVASIDYRLMGRTDPTTACDASTPGFSTTLLCSNNTLNNMAWYWAMQDLNAAIKFIVYNNAALNLNIDTSKIFLYGESAGAITSLSLAYASPSEINTQLPSIVNDPNGGSIDATTIPECQSVVYKISGVGAVAGAVAKSAFIGNNETTPVVMLHNPCDNLVTSDSTPTNFKIPTPQSFCWAYFYGSRAIADIFDQHKTNGYTVPYHHLYVICDTANLISPDHKLRAVDVDTFAGNYFMDFVSKIVTNTPFPAPPSWPTVTTLNAWHSNTKCTGSLRCLNYISRPGNSGNENGNTENEKSKISFSPNPATNTITVQASNISCPKTDIILYNMQGQVLYRRTVNTALRNNLTEIISLDRFASGTYLIALRGASYYQKEIIIKY